jgi:hypothetical protein
MWYLGSYEVDICIEEDSGVSLKQLWGCDAESPCALAVPFVVVITLFSSSLVASLYGVLAY